MYFYIVLLLDFAVEAVSGALSAYCFTLSICSVAAVCSDAVYFLVRAVTPDFLVWQPQSARRWGIAWILIWVLQAPMWQYALQRYSLLLVFFITSVLKTVHLMLLKRCFPLAQTPCAIHSYIEIPEEDRIVGYCFITCGYVLMHGPPDDWMLIACFFLLEVLPLIHSGMKHNWGLACLQYFRPPWALGYPAAHPTLPAGAYRSIGSLLKAVTAVVPDECAEHDFCSICFDNLCRPGGGAAMAGISVLTQRRLGPALAAARRQARKVGSASLSAIRTPATWVGGRVATTRCGHSFHASCLQAAAAEARFPDEVPSDLHAFMPQSLRLQRALRAARCPQCRTALASPEYLGNVLEPPGEEQLEDAHMVFLGGVIIGISLLLGHCIAQAILQDRAPLMTIVRDLPKDLADAWRWVLQDVEARAAKTSTHHAYVILVFTLLFIVASSVTDGDEL